MMDFDSIAGMAEMKLDSLLLERKAQAMQYTIICQTVGELGKQLLKPHGISWQVDTDFTDSAVKVRFRKASTRAYPRPSPLTGCPKSSRVSRIG